MPIAVVPKTPRANRSSTRSEERWIMTKPEKNSRHCQWLYGEPRERNFCETPVGLGEVWCQKHKELVYVREDRNRRKRRDIRPFGGVRKAA